MTPANEQAPQAPDGLRVVQDGPIRRLTLARPRRRNALSAALIAALRREIAAIAEGGETRVVVLAGEGPIFCAGADLTEFTEAGDPDRLRADAEALTDLLDAMTTCPLPIVAAVQGAAYGGGAGLVCAADIAVAVTGTQFSLSEARLGLVPATIGPYVVAALGPREAQARMLLAAPFGVEDALRSGLIQQVVAPTELDGAIAGVVGNLLLGAPGALAAIKRMVRQVAGHDPTAVRELTIALLAARRASDEGQEGMAAFLAKRSPRWAPPVEQSAP